MDVQALLQTIETYKTPAKVLRHRKCKDCSNYIRWSEKQQNGWNLNFLKISLLVISLLLYYEGRGEGHWTEVTNCESQPENFLTPEMCELLIITFLTIGNSNQSNHYNKEWHGTNSFLIFGNVCFQHCWRIWTQCCFSKLWWRDLVTVGLVRNPPTTFYTKQKEALNFQMHGFNTYLNHSYL